MIKRSIVIGILFIFTGFAFQSCGGSKNVVSKEQYEQTENDLLKRERDLQDKTIEMLDLKNQIIILQSEVSDLKDNKSSLKEKKDSLSLQLLEVKNESRVLEDKLFESYAEKERLRLENSALVERVYQNQDSIRYVLEMAATKQSENNLLMELGVSKSTVTKVNPKKEEISIKETINNEIKKDNIYKNAELEKAISPVMNLTTEEYQTRYQSALNLYFADNFVGAITEFKSLLKIDAVNDYSDNCQYWIAESYYSQELFEEAIVEFRKVLQYKDSNKIDHAIFKTGMSYLRLKRTQEGLQEFKTLVETYPQSELVAKVKTIIDSGSF